MGSLKKFASVLLLSIACLASFSSALKCYRCQWIEGGQDSELIQNSTEGCESKLTEQDIREVNSLTYPRKYSQLQAQKAREEAAEENLKDGARAAREIESLDLKPGSPSASDIYDDEVDEPADDTPYSYEDQKSASPGPGTLSASSPKFPSTPAAKPLINHSSSLTVNPPDSSASPAIQRAGGRRLKDNDQSQNSILNDFSSIHPACVTITGIFQNKRIIIRDYHFTETKGSVNGKCGDSYPPEVSTILEELLSPETRGEWERETRAIYGLRVAYCNTDACNDESYKNEDPCGDGSDPGVRIPLQVPNGKSRFF